MTVNPAPNIISASRRTDIPAFYMPWFMSRLRAGSAAYPNPFSGQLHTVSLRQEDVHSIVFWSKFYGPFLRHIPELEASGYPYICHYTITGAPRALEPLVPRWERTVAVFQQLAALMGPRRMLWRFDPIVITSELTPDYYREKFRVLAGVLQGYTERCYLSFATFYSKVQRNFVSAGLSPLEPTLETKRTLLAELAEIAAEKRITLYACCQAMLLNNTIHPARCVDSELLAELFPDRTLRVQQRPTRSGCGCAASRDVGVYNTCGYGCVYCYANLNHDAARSNMRSHDPKREIIHSNGSHAPG